MQKLLNKFSPDDIYSKRHLHLVEFYLVIDGLIFYLIFKYTDAINAMSASKYHNWIVNGSGKLFITYHGALILYILWPILVIIGGSIRLDFAAKADDGTLASFKAAILIYARWVFLLGTAITIMLSTLPFTPDSNVFVSAKAGYMHYAWPGTNMKTIDAIPNKKFVNTRTVTSTEFTQIDGKTFEVNGKKYTAANKQNIRHIYSKNTKHNEIKVKYLTPKANAPAYIKDALNYKNPDQPHFNLNNFTTVTIKIKS